MPPTLQQPGEGSKAVRATFPRLVATGPIAGRAAPGRELASRGFPAARSHPMIQRYRSGMDVIARKQGP